MGLELRQPTRENLTSFIEQELRHALITGKLRPGDRLNIRSLAAELGTSATPVREAIIKLVAARALDMRPGQAFQVPVLSAARYREICTIRKAIEGLAAERAASHVGAAQIERLARLNERFQKAKANGHYRTALDCNQQFRFGLYQAAEMPTLMAIIEGLWLQIGPSFNLLFPQAPRAGGLGHDYEAALSALRRRDGASVRAAIERAIDAGSAILLPYLEAPQAAGNRTARGPAALPTHPRALASAPRRRTAATLRG